MIDQYDIVLFLTDTLKGTEWRPVAVESSPDQITVIIRRDGDPSKIERVPITDWDEAMYRAGVARIKRYDPLSDTTRNIE